MPELQTQHRFLRVCWNKLDCKKSGPLCDRGERMTKLVVKDPKAFENGWLWLMMSNMTKDELVEFMEGEE